MAAGGERGSLGDGGTRGRSPLFNLYSRGALTYLTADSILLSGLGSITRIL